MNSTSRVFRWQDYIESILLALLIALVIRSFVVTGYRVPTQTMSPTLVPGDFIFSWRLPYGLKIPFSDKKIGLGQPVRGEVVVFSFPDQPRVTYVKRVIALAGDLLEIKAGEVYLNSKKLKYEKLQTIDDNQDIWSESFDSSSRKILRNQSGQSSKNFGPLLVAQGEVFLLGDNRDLSDDSRYWGTVPIEKIEGRASVIWLALSWPGGSWPTLNWQRIMTPIN